MHYYFRILKPLHTKQRSKVTLNKDCNWKNIVYKIEDSSHAHAIQYENVHDDSSKAEIVVKCTEKPSTQSQTISKNRKETSQKSLKQVIMRPCICPILLSLMLALLIQKVMKTITT